MARRKKKVNFVAAVDDLWQIQHEKVQFYGVSEWSDGDGGT